MCSETDRIATMAHDGNIIADSGSIETNEKNAGKCRDSTKRKFWKCCFVSNDVFFFSFCMYVDVSFK